MQEKQKRWDDSVMQMPKGMTLTDHGNYIEITRRWSKTIAFFMTVFSVFWWFILAKILLIYISW